MRDRTIAELNVNRPSTKIAGQTRRIFVLLLLASSFLVPDTQAATRLRVTATEVHDFSDGLALVVVNKRYGFVDLRGKMAIKPSFEYADDFGDGFAPVLQRGKYGFINHKGMVVIEARFDAAGRFSDGLAPVKIGEKWGYIDRDGKWAIVPQYERAASFSEGMAVIAVNDRYGFVDRDGKMAIAPRFNSGVYGSFHEGLAVIKGGLVQMGQGAFVTDQSGFIDQDGNIVIEPQFAYAGNFGGGLAPVRKAGKYGYIDRNGKVAIEPQFDEAGEFSEGLARARVGDRWGFIDNRGAWVISPGFDDAGDFRNGLARVKKEGAWYFVDNAPGDNALNERGAGGPTGTVLSKAEAPKQTEALKKTAVIVAAGVTRSGVIPLPAPPEKEPPACASDAAGPNCLPRAAEYGAWQGTGLLMGSAVCMALLLYKRRRNNAEKRSG